MVLGMGTDSTPNALVARLVSGRVPIAPLAASRTVRDMSESVKSEWHVLLVVVLRVVVELLRQVPAGVVHMGAAGIAAFLVRRIVRRYRTISLQRRRARRRGKDE